jgi:D-aminopeptidase
MEQVRRRARELGIQIGQMKPGDLNMITNVAGVTVGQVTLDPGSGSIRTGVTAILPHAESIFDQKVPAAVHTINGFGKATGFEQVRELGVLETPIVLTNTLSVGTVWDALVTWTIRKASDPDMVTSVNPVVGECNDSFLNDIQRRLISAEHVLSALDSAESGKMAEGAVGAGTGMTCFGYKGGIGTSSRRVGPWIVGILLVSNFGERGQLVIDGIPAGRSLLDEQDEPRETDGSVVIVVATDAPFSDRQLGRLARRTALGLARIGSTIGHTSGDFAIAFSTAYRISTSDADTVMTFPRLAEGQMNLFFQATVEATEEAVLNSLFMADTITGYLGQSSPALPVDRVLEIMRSYRYLESDQ